MMKVYRIEHYRHGTSDGYEFATSHAEAKTLKAKYHAEVDAEERGGNSTIEVLEVEISKSGIVKALKSYASHPNNG